MQLSEDLDAERVEQSFAVPADHDRLDSVDHPVGQHDRERRHCHERDRSERLDFDAMVDATPRQPGQRDPGDRIQAVQYQPGHKRDGEGP